MNKKIACAMVLFFIVSQVIIFGVNREPWFDVSFSLQTVHNLRVNGLGSIDFFHYDVHPPTYYYMDYLWSYLNPPGISEYHWAQELSVVFELLFLLFAGLALQKAFGKSGTTAVILLALCTTYLHYGTEVRMYAMVMMLSAIVFLAVMEGLKGKWLWIGSIALLLLPLSHYFASMAIVFYAGMYFILAKRKKEFSWKKLGVLLAFGMVGLLLALSFALPQKARVEGTWFQAPSPTDWPSAVFYSFFMIEQFDPNVLFTVLYVGLIGFIVLCAWQAWRLLNKSALDDEEVLLFIMGATALFPLVGLVGAPLLGGNGFAHLYHHRFFLVVDWMFAAMSFIMLSRWLSKKTIVVNAVTYGCVVAGLVAMIVIYCFSVHHELQHLMAATPCITADGGYIQIAHESPFSSLPYEVYAREHGCYWYNFVSTNQTVRMLNGGGGDAMSEGSMFYNQSLPEGDFFYVAAAATIPLDGNYSDVKLEDGVALLFIKRGPVHNLSEWNRQVYYDEKIGLSFINWMRKTNGSGNVSVRFTG